MKLSYRLETVASFVPKGSNLADIGTDHGYIPIYLALNGIIDRAIAMDVRMGPLLRASEHIKEYKLEEVIETRLSDGAAALKPGEADTVIIAGMGGELVIHILEDGKHVWDTVDRWILSPQSDLDKVRRYLEQNSFLITEETMVEEDGKYYTVMMAVRGHMEVQKEIYYRYGRLLIEKKAPVLQAYLDWEENLKACVLEGLKEKDTPAAKLRAEHIREELNWIKEARDEMQ